MRFLSWLFNCFTSPSSDFLEEDDDELTLADLMEYKEVFVTLMEEIMVRNDPLLIGTAKQLVKLNFAIP